jgi:hypothetical protein
MTEAVDPFVDPATKCAGLRQSESAIAQRIDERCIRPWDSRAIRDESFSSGKFGGSRAATPSYLCVVQMLCNCRRFDPYPEVRKVV